jgi:hypothetical protein
MKLIYDARRGPLMDDDIPNGNAKADLLAHALFFLDTPAFTWHYSSPKALLKRVANQPLPPVFTVVLLMLHNLDRGHQ